jgi:hypothetical protein
LIGSTAISAQYFHSDSGDGSNPAFEKKRQGFKFVLLDVTPPSLPIPVKNIQIYPSLNALKFAVWACC